MMNVVEARIMNFVEELSVADVIRTEPDFRESYMARFAPVAVGEIKTYNGEVKWDPAAVKPVELTLKNKDYFAFAVDDVEELKTKPHQIDKQARKQARNISRKEDAFLFELIAEGAGTEMEVEFSKPSQAYDILVDANKELSKNDAPFEDRYLVISHNVLGMLEKDDRFTKYEKILNNGLVVGTDINGSKLIVSNALPKNTLLAIQKEGVGFERFLDKLETMRLQDAFADGIRGLSVYDGVLLEKDYAVAIKLTAPSTKASTK